RSFEAGDEALIAVRAGVREGVERLGMLDDATDVPECFLAETCEDVACEDVLAALLEGLVHVHAAAVIAHERLGHEGDGLTVLPCDVMDHILQDLNLVGLLDERTAAHPDLTLPCVRDLVMMNLGLDAHGFELQAHLGAKVSEAVHWGNREVARSEEHTSEL